MSQWSPRLERSTFPWNPHQFRCNLATYRPEPKVKQVTKHAMSVSQNLLGAHEYCCSPEFTVTAGQVIWTRREHHHISN